MANGITTEGRKELIDFRVANSVSESAWRQFLWSLQGRGLAGKALKLITTDGCAGLIAAVEEVYGETRRQRCWFHKMQNVAGHIRRRDQSDVLRGLRIVYGAANRRRAERACVRWAKKWVECYPAVVRCVEVDLEELLNCFSVPGQHRRTIRTTNPIERCIREFQRRTDPIGTFDYDDSIERIMFGLVSNMNGKFAAHVGRKIRRKKRAA